MISNGSLQAFAANVSHTLPPARHGPRPAQQGAGQAGSSTAEIARTLQVRAARPAAEASPSAPAGASPASASPGSISPVPGKSAARGSVLDLRV